MSQKKTSQKRAVRSASPAGNAAKKDAIRAPELAAIGLRNDFYRDSYKTNRMLTVGLLVAIAVSIVFNIILFSVKPEVRVVSVDVNGRVVPVVSTLEPMHKDSNVSNWVASMVVDLNTYDFRNWRRHFQEMQGHFSDSGWISYSRAIEASRIISLVESDQLLVSAITSGAPVITSKGPYQGRYAWRVEFPIVVTYEGGSNTRTQNLRVTAVVVRAADLVRHPNGLVIEQIVSREQ